MDAGDCTLNHSGCDWERVVGACSTGHGADGFVTICTIQRSSCWGAVTVGVTSQLAFIGVVLWLLVSRFTVTLGIGASTLGIGASTLGIGASTLGR